MPNRKSIFYSFECSGRERGAATILMAFLIINILLMVGLTAASIMVLNIRMSAEIADSVPAFYAADAGSELCLYQVRMLNADVCLEAGTLGNSATFSARKASGESKIKSTGSFKETSRESEITW